MRRFSVRALLPGVIAAGLTALGSAAMAAELRLVVELRPDQTRGHLEQITAGAFDGRVSVTPMFPDIDPDDDPYSLRSFYTVDATSGDETESPWDVAYYLLGRGDFLRVEPDLADVLVNPTARSAGCLDGIDDARTADPAWALMAVNADRAWELTSPAGRQTFWRGCSRLSHRYRLVES